jgi:hypothetical protein
VQAAALRTRPEIVVATPGRLIDHVRNTHSVGLEVGLPRHSSDESGAAASRVRRITRCHVTALSSTNHAIPLASHLTRFTFYETSFSFFSFFLHIEEFSGVYMMIMNYQFTLRK